MERARQLIRPYVERKGTIGIYVVGSATRPYRDARSDYDIEVVVEDDVYDALPDAERHVLVIDEGPPRRVDHEFYLWSWSAFRALLESTQDLFHQPYQHAVVLHDPDERVGPVVEALAALPDGVRAERLKVHWLEFVFGVGRARKTWERGLELDAHLVAADALRSLVKLCFLVRRSWASTRHWTAEELALLGVPDDLLADLADAVGDPAPERLGALATRVKAWLAAEGATFHEDPDALMAWAFLTAEGRAAFARWAPS